MRMPIDVKSKVYFWSQTSLVILFVAGVNYPVAFPNRLNVEPFSCLSRSPATLKVLLSVSFFRLISLDSSPHHQSTDAAACLVARPQRRYLSRHLSGLVESRVLHIDLVLHSNGHTRQVLGKEGTHPSVKVD